MSKEINNKIVYLKDYAVPAYFVKNYKLNFDLYEEETIVTTIAEYYKNNKSDETELVLHGEDIELISIFLDEKELWEDDYIIKNNKLLLEIEKEDFSLKVITKIHPETNTTLMWLYKSWGKFCTQCETHGFRRMTYFQDRPDVMTLFSVRITADKEKYPVLLSNGNKIEEGNLEENRHFVVWEDPFKKPCYLFALVAGDLGVLEDSFTTMSGKEVALKIFTESHNIHKTPFAMESLKKSMKWDEERFGREYDLDIFMIVAVDDFNSGAMENKWLNIFNSSCVFATKETATDRDFIRVEKVIAHEYFHNWTGDRVTCRDWFQLSLKEGLTVYRDHEFTCDMHSRSVARIEGVKLLKNYQFREDSGPMAHSIRPASFEEISNFYTFTVYEKWAEVIWIYESILWTEGFRLGMDLYFKRHDGEAVTTEDFLAAMRDANIWLLDELGIELDQMQNWYNQAGTPIVDVVSDYDPEKKELTLFFRQHCPDTSETPIGKKKPFLIPIKYGVFEKESQREVFSWVEILDDFEKKIIIEDVKGEVVLSLLRDFSAPIKLKYAYSQEDYLFLIEHDTNNFNRFEAFQNLAKEILLESISWEKLVNISFLSKAYQSILNNNKLDNSFRAETLILPSEWELADLVWENVNPAVIHQIRNNLEKEMAVHFEDNFCRIYEDLFFKKQELYSIDVEFVGNRKLKNLALKYVTIASWKNNLAYEQFKSATNMTDQMWALQALILINNDIRKKALEEFHDKWKTDANVMDKWFSLQATSPLERELEDIKSLLNHELFEITNPNKVRSVLNAFANLNPYHFHREDWAWYELIANKVIELNGLNPMVASRLVKSMINWKILEPKRAELLKAQLERINKEDLSSDVGEVVRKSLKS